MNRRGLLPAFLCVVVALAGCDGRTEEEHERSARDGGEMPPALADSARLSEGLGPQVYVVDDGDFLGPSNRRLAMSTRTENQVDKEIRNLLDDSDSE